LTDLATLAADAFIFGYPLVYNVTALQAIAAQGMSSLPATPFNQFGFATTLATPDDRFVSVNNDTIYGLAQLDLSGGPLLLHVPDTDGSYYVLQFVDTWTNNFAYVGRRATGTQEADYLIVGPGKEVVNPQNLTVIVAPTDLVTIVGRLACSGIDDLPRVLELQEQFTLTAVDTNTQPIGIPHGTITSPEPLTFWDNLRLWSQAYRPAGDDDRGYLASLEALGLLDPGNPYEDLASNLAGALTDGYDSGRRRLEELARETDPNAVNGWQMNLHLFDYNRATFEVGTVRSEEWTIADRDSAYRTRAVAARNGLWGNHAYEAVYPQVYVDSDGAQLTGSNTYEITFAQLPPVDAFWSLTMYSVPDYYLVDNSINRYSIGDRTPGIQYGSNGSLTVYLQRDEPTDSAKKANWLPTPAGDFRPMLRMYQPHEAVLDGTYTLPAIHRVSPD
jgi:hypothetical protein